MESKDKSLTRIPPRDLPLTRLTRENLAQEIFQAFTRGRNPETVRSDLKGIQAFGEWLGVRDFDKLCKTLLFSDKDSQKCHGNANRLAQRYRAFLLEAKHPDGQTKYAPATVKRRLDSVRSIVRFARTFGAVPWEIEVDPVQVEAYVDTKGPGTDRFVDVILDLETKNDPMSVRDRAMLILIHDAALRRNEVATLDLEHVEFELHRVWVKAKKRLKRQEIRISPEIEAALKSWLMIRGDAPGPLFTSFDRSKRRTDKRLDGSSIWRIVEKYGLGKTHGLRHLAITELSEREKDLIKVMKFARHKDPKTTLGYIDNLKEASSEAASKLAEIRRQRSSGKNTGKESK